MSASSAAPGRPSPLLALWSRDDVRAAIVDFLPTRTIATLPFVAKPLREVQSRLLITATTRRGKTVPNPPTARACLDALLVGEPQHLCEDWERGLEAWYQLGGTTGAIAASHLVLRKPTSLLAPIGGNQIGFTSLFAPSDGNHIGFTSQSLAPSGSNHIGFARPLRDPSRRLRDMLVTRFRVEMSFFLCPAGGEVGCVILSGPNSPVDPGDLDEDADAISDLLCALTFPRTQGQNLLFINNFGSERVIVAGATPNTKYTVDVIFRHESVTSGLCAADVSVNGQRVIQEMPVEVRPLSSIQLYNITAGTSRIGNIDIWYERARPDQSWNE